MYCATSFWERLNSSKRAWMYAERVWWPAASAGAVVVLFMGADCFDGAGGDPFTTPLRTDARPSSRGPGVEASLRVPLRGVAAVRGAARGICDADVPACGGLGFILPGQGPRQ